MDALRMKTPPWDIQGIECAVWGWLEHWLLQCQEKVKTLFVAA